MDSRLQFLCARKLFDTLPLKIEVYFFTPVYMGLLREHFK